MTHLHFNSLIHSPLPNDHIKFEPRVDMRPALNNAIYYLINNNDKHAYNALTIIVQFHGITRR